MKTTFEKELRRIFDQDSLMDHVSYVGRSCYGRLDGELRVRAQFQSMGISNHYDALKISLLNRREGVVDSVILRLNEVWGLKQTSNPNFREGIYPYLWEDGGDLVWYVYQPSASDFQKLRNVVNDYLEVFREPEQDFQQSL